MQFGWSEQHDQMREAVERLCAGFDLDYWRERDAEGGFPHDFHSAMAEGGWLGIAMPEEFGGSGLGIVEAAILMQAVARSGAGMSGCSAIRSAFPGRGERLAVETESRFLRGRMPSSRSRSLPNRPSNSSRYQPRVGR